MNSKNVNSKVDYITKDYEGFRKMMMDLIPLKTPEWTDFSENDLGVVLLELLASGLDVLSFYQDKAFAESILSTAQNRRSVLNICRSLGYELARQTPAKFKLKITKSADYEDEDVVISKGTKVSTDPKAGNPIVFETDKSLTIKANTLEGYVTVTQGETVKGEVAGAGTGYPNQKIKLGMADVLVETLEVYTTFRNQYESTSEQSRTYWIRVDDFLNSSPEDKHYMVEVDEFNNGYLVFGNGISGATVSPDLNVNADYRYGGGVIGNVGINTINTLPVNDIAGIAQLTNPEPPIVKGKDSESLQHAKVSAPKFFRMQDRCITKQDFEDLCSMEDGVALVHVVESFNIRSEVFIYIVPSDFSSTVPEELKERLIKKINDKKLLKDTPVIKDPTYLEFDIDVKIIAYSNFVNSEVQKATEAILRKAFGIQNMSYNEEVLIANIYNECLKVPGVRNIVINKPTKDVLVYDSETNTPRVAKLNNLKVTVEGGVGDSEH